MRLQKDSIEAEKGSKYKKNDSINQKHGNNNYTNRIRNGTSTFDYNYNKLLEESTAYPFYGESKTNTNILKDEESFLHTRFYDESPEENYFSRNENNFWNLPNLDENLFTRTINSESKYSRENIYWTKITEKNKREVFDNKDHRCHSSNYNHFSRDLYDRPNLNRVIGSPVKKNSERDSESPKNKKENVFPNLNVLLARYKTIEDHKDNIKSDNSKKIAEKHDFEYEPEPNETKKEILVSFRISEISHQVDEKSRVTLKAQEMDFITQKEPNINNVSTDSNTKKEFIKNSLSILKLEDQQNRKLDYNEKECTINKNKLEKTSEKEEIKVSSKNDLEQENERKILSKEKENNVKLFKKHKTYKFNWKHYFEETIYINKLFFILIMKIQAFCIKMNNAKNLYFKNKSKCTISSIKAVQIKRNLKRRKNAIFRK